MLSIGLMSGTSMDGIDAALLETNGEPDQLIEHGHLSLAYHPAFKTWLKIAEYAVRQMQGDMAASQVYFSQAKFDYLLNELNIEPSKLKDHLQGLAHYADFTDLDAVIQHSTDLHVQAVKQLLIKTGYQAEQIDVIGYHGQALFHQPSKKISVIVGDGADLAKQLGITVVNDFRRQDIEAGGQGAPFAPLYHQALAIRDKHLPLAVINCGGIANISLIQNDNPLDLIGFDTGPGNGLIDKFIKQKTQGREHMDKDGQYGKQGKVNQTVVTALYEKSIIKQGENYFVTPPPKSLDIGDMVLIPELNALSLEDACATLEFFTADSIVKSLQYAKIALPTTWVLAGGGWYNPVIKQSLQVQLQAYIQKPLSILTADEIAWNSQAMEAQIFAYFAVRSLQGKILSVPGTTNVSKPTSGGIIHKYQPLT